jgi:hypothetical protein
VAPQNATLAAFDPEQPGPRGRSAPSGVVNCTSRATSGSRTRSEAVPSQRQSTRSSSRRLISGRSPHPAGSWSEPIWTSARPPRSMAMRSAVVTGRLITAVCHSPCPLFEQPDLPAQLGQPADTAGGSSFA